MPPPGLTAPIQSSKFPAAMPLQMANTVDQTQAVPGITVSTTGVGASLKQGCEQSAQQLDHVQNAELQTPASPLATGSEIPEDATKILRLQELADGLDEPSAHAASNLFLSRRHDGSVHEGIGAPRVHAQFTLKGDPASCELGESGAVLEAPVKENSARQVRFGPTAGDGDEPAVQTEVMVLPYEEVYRSRVSGWLTSSRELMCKIHHAETSYAGSQSGDVNAKKQGLQAYKNLLVQSEPAKKALSIFVHAHRLSASVPRFNPAGEKLPAGLTFFTSDVRELGSAWRDMRKLIREERDEYRPQQYFFRMPDECESHDPEDGELVELDQHAPQAVSSLFLQKELHIEITDETNLVNSTRAYRWITSFEGSQASSTLVQASIQFWGEFLRAMTSDSWGEREEDLDLPGVDRNFEIVVLEGTRSPEAEPPSWGEWIMQMFRWA